MTAPVITHVGTCVRDLAASEAFYVGALGFTRLRDLRPPDAVTGKLLRVDEPVGLTAVYLGCGSFVLELLHFDRPGNAPARERAITEPGLTHLSFSVDDLAATCALVAQHGGTVLDDTDVRMAVLVRDPDGQIIELVSAGRAMSGESGAVVFDPYSSTYFDDPYDVYRRMRDEAPVLHNEDLGFYALSRWDDVVAAERDWATYSSAYGIDLGSLRSGTMYQHESLIMMDPPKHDRMRALVSRVFTPRAISALEPMVRDVIVGYLDALDGRDEVDLVAEFSAYFPVEIISRMLGIPADMRQQVRLWLDQTLHREVGRPNPSAASMDAAVAMGTYFYELSVEKRANPVDDMLSRLTQVEVEDDDGTMVGLDDVAIAGFGSLLGGAGAETVTKLIGNAVVEFARHPDQWAMVRADPALIPGAFEELLRYLPPSQFQGRMAVREVSLHGTVIPPMSPVLLMTGAATRDERHFDDPDRFDIQRPAALSLGFGHGIHSCLGAALARLEGRVAIEELAKRYPSYELIEDGLARVQMINVAGWSNVPIRIH